jgi:drug/metabolite transporter (DMT)-like permease
VLVFTMPFWTLLLAWPVLHERVRGLQWLGILFALLGLSLVVEPWNWREGLHAKIWAVVSGLGWAAGTIATKYFERSRRLEMLNFLAWQMALGILPFMLIPVFVPLPPTNWNAGYLLLLLHTGAVSTALGFLLWIAILRWLPAGTASINMLAIPVVALLCSMVFLGERLDRIEWIGIACIGAGLAIVSAQAWRETRAARAVRAARDASSQASPVQDGDPARRA